jgi:Na+/pantothenate symporter
MYVVQKIITKAIFFTGHKVIRAEAMIVGRICLFVLAENFFFVGAIGIASIPNLQACICCGDSRGHMP